MKTATRETAFEVPELWNPNAAACWSILFTPAFGAYLHARNWRSMGDFQRARANARWMLASLTLTALVVVSATIPDSKIAPADVTLKIAAFILLFAWYFSEGKAQIEYVKKHYGEGYSRRHWAKPMWVSIGAYVIVVAILIVIAVASSPLSAEVAEEQTKILMADQFAKSPETQKVKIENITLLQKSDNLYAVA